MPKFFENMEKSDATALITALFREFVVVEGKVGSPYISPSSLDCPVACAFKLTEMPVMDSTESFQSRSFADNGNDRHSRIQDFLSQTEYWVDVEQYVKEKNLPLTIVEKQGHEVLLLSEELRVRFRCDGMLLINGEYYVLEIKTERSSVNARRTSADPKHYSQGVTYATLLDTSRILWVYEGRDFLEQKVFAQDVSSSEKADIVSYIKYILENKDKPYLMERNTKACTYCGYKKYCKEYFKNAKKEGLIK